MAASRLSAISRRRSRSRQTYKTNELYQYRQLADKRIPSEGAMRAKAREYAFCRAWGNRIIVVSEIINSESEIGEIAFMKHQNERVGISIGLAAILWQSAAQSRMKLNAAYFCEARGKSCAISRRKEIKIVS